MHLQYVAVHYLVKVENPKMLLTLTAPQHNRLLTCFWGHIEDLIQHLTIVRQTVLRQSLKMHHDIVFHYRADFAETGGLAWVD